MKQFENKRANNWFSERLPLATLKKWIFEEKIPGGSRFAYSLGSAALFLFLLLIITGIWQMFVYDPSVDHAYDSYTYLRLNVPFGWLINGLHYWGGTAFSVVVGLHILRVFIWGAYKKPREIIWLAGMVLVILTAFFMFTGPVLPWDKKGYWACKVGSDMIGTIPGLGSFIQALFWGSERMGQLTLTRMFTWHVEILPILMVLFVGIHLIAFRVYGSVGPWNEKKRNVTGWFWPEQIFKDVVVSFFIFLLLVALSVFVPPPFSGAADPLDTTYIPKPEWNFSFFYQILKYFSGSWEPVGIVGIPLLIILFFVSLPFIDRTKERNPLKRLFVISIGTLFFTLILAFTLIGLWSAPPSETKLSLKETSTPIKTPSSKELEGLNLPSSSSLKEIEGLQLPKTPPSKKTHLLTLSSKGKEIFDAQGCNACHSTTGEESHKLGPDLITALSQRKDLTKNWLHTQIVAPKKHNPNSTMPAYNHLTPQQLDELTVYLEKLSKMSPPKEMHKVKYGQSINIVGNPENGMHLYEKFCLQCHGPNGQTNAKDFTPLSGVPPLNPISKSLFNQNVAIFLKNIDPYIQHGGPNLEQGPNMPNFGDSYSLTQQQISDIEAYILQLNGVNRAKINDPGIAPKTFFFIVLGVSGGVIALGFFYWLIRRK